MEEKNYVDMKSPFTGGKVTLESKPVELTYRDEKVTIIRKYYKCEDTGTEFSDAAVDSDMMWDVFRAYCEKKGFESFDEILPREPRQTPKWLYRLEYKDSSCGLWYNGEGKWCFEEGIGSVDGCETKTLPMDYDERYKQDGRDWFSSCSKKEDLMHWYSLEDAKTLIEKGFVFTRYLATEYHEYEQETVFIKETALYREEIDIFDLFKEKDKKDNGKWISVDDDLPPYDKEVIVLSDYINGKYVKGAHRISFGHRPNPSGWDGKNIDTGEVTHYEPNTYDGWNIPGVTHWIPCPPIEGEDEKRYMDYD